MPKPKSIKQEISPKHETERMKLKRKNSHPVRKYFVCESDRQQRCRFCGWQTRDNATRMVAHVVHRCKNTPASIKEEMHSFMMEAEERERESSFTNYNKKDIHNLFRSILDDRKRECVYCNWTTTRNLTRMRYHIMQTCESVPMAIRARFMKQESTEEQCDSYCIINVEDGDRKEFRLVSSNLMEDPITVDMMDETTINVVEYENQDELYYEATIMDEEEPGTKFSPRNTDDVDEQTGLELVENDVLEIEDDGSSVDEEDEKNILSVGGQFPARGNSSPKHMDVSFSDEAESKFKQEKQVTTARPAVAPRKYQKKILPQKRQTSDTTVLNLGVNPPKKYTRQSQRICNQLAVEAPRANLRPLQHNKPARDVMKTEEAGKPTARPIEFQIVTEIPEEAEDSTAVPEEAGTTIPPSNERLGLHNTRQQAEEGGSCHSFGGGHVYPQEAPQSVDHKLQFTKAVISRPAPAFEATGVVDGVFKKVKLSDYRGKYVVFFFYPLDFTFVCPTEILAFSDRVNEFKNLNAEVIAASIDSHFTHLAWINTPRKEGGLGKINIPLVSDITHSISKDYGVFLDDLGHTLRGLFIIDDRGILRQITMNDLPVGRSVDETLRLVQAFQYTDKHGEVCPAGWKPGQDTIVPNPEAKIKYFEKNH